MKNVLKRVAGLLLVLSLLMMIPMTVFAVDIDPEDNRTVISEVRGITVVSSEDDTAKTIESEFVYGGDITKSDSPYIKCTNDDGSQAYFYNASWEKQVDGIWKSNSDLSVDQFTSGTWRYRARVYIDNDDNYVATGTTPGVDFRLAEGVKVYVNDEEWTTDEYSYNFNKNNFGDCYTSILVYKTFEMEEPEDVFFPDSDGFNIPTNYVNVAIKEVDVSKDVEGGTKPYTFSKLSGPTWITVSEAGVISGTPTAVAATNADLVVKVVDSASHSSQITISVAETKADPALRAQIHTIVATSDNIASIPVIGDSVESLPSIEVTEGYPAYFYSGTWQYKNGEEWLDTASSSVFEEGKVYRYKSTIYVDNDGNWTLNNAGDWFVLADDLTVKFNDNPMTLKTKEVDEVEVLDLNIGNDSSSITSFSPEYPAIVGETPVAGRISMAELFKDVEYGYDSVEVIPVIIRITSAATVNYQNMSYELTGENPDAFEVTLYNEDRTIEGPNSEYGISFFSIKPVFGLEVGDYETTLTLKYDKDGDSTYETTIGSVHVSFGVTEASSTGDEEEITGSIVAPMIDDAEVGYSDLAFSAVAVGITSDTTLDADNLRFVLSGTNDDAFTVQIHASTLDGPGLWNDAYTFGVKPVTGLAIGTYTATLTLEYDKDGDETYETTIGSCDVSFAVTSASSPEPTTYTVGVNGGIADPGIAAEGTTITLTANSPAEGKEFDEWTATVGTVSFANANLSTTTFLMPAENVVVTANYKDIVPEGSITAPSFTSQEEGYSEISSSAVTITLTKNYQISPSRLHAELTGTNNDAFEFYLNNSAGLLCDTGSWSNIFFANPVTGLTAGTYTATLTLSYDADNDGTYEITIGSSDLSFTVTSSSSPEPTTITAVSVSNVELPEIGEGLSDLSNSPSSLTYGGAYQMAGFGLRVKNGDSWDEFNDSSDKVVAGETYRAEITLSATSTDKFDSGITDSDITINGQAGKFVAFYNSYSMIAVAIEFSYESSTPEPTVIESVTITGVTAPVTGETKTIDGITTSTTGASINTSNTYWLVGGELVNFGADVFEAETVYGIYVTVEPEEGYEFADTITATINGNEPALIDKTGTDNIYRVIVYHFPATEASSSTPTSYNVLVSATDVSDGSEVEGSHIQLIDDEGNVIEEWASTTPAHEVEDLAIETEYTLKVTVATEGYTIPTETTFTISSGGTITYTGSVTDEQVLLIELAKTHVEIACVDSEDDPLSGITLQVEDSEGNVVEEWTTTSDSHAIEGLKTGEEYTLKTVIDSESNDVCTFTIDDEGAVTTTGTLDSGVIVVSITEPLTPTMCIITTDYNGGINKTWETEQDFQVGNEVEFTSDLMSSIASSVDPLMTGIEFDCVEIDGIRYEVGDTYEVTGDVTFKLLWKAAEGYCLVTYDLNGGIEGTNFIPYQAYLTGQTFTLVEPDTSFATAPEGSHFAGVDYLDEEWCVGDDIEITADGTMTFAWLTNDIVWTIVDGATLTEDDELGAGFWLEFASQDGLGLLKVVEEDEDTIKVLTLEDKHLFSMVDEGDSSRLVLGEGVTSEDNIVYTITEADKTEYPELKPYTTASLLFSEEGGTPTPTTYSLTVNTNGDGNVGYKKGSGTPSEFHNQIIDNSVKENDVYVLQAKPNSGNKFVKWTKDGADYSTTAKISVTITADVVYEAFFETKPTTTGGGGGGSSTPTSFKITTKADSDGVTISPKNPTVSKNKSQEFTFTTAEGFEIVDVLVDGKSVGAVEKYTLEEVTKKHTIEVKTQKTSTSGDNNTSNNTSENPADKFTDVKKSDWFYDNVNYVVKNGLFNGTTETTFGPNEKITRGMLVAVLYRLAGATDKELSTFDDVDPEMYYSAPIAWAAKNKYVAGVGDNKFDPDAYITRQDLATIIYRYLKAQGKGFEGSWMFLLEYDDREEIAEYAYEPICYLTMNKILSGKGENLIDPTGFATRAETAKIIQMVRELIKK